MYYNLIIYQIKVFILFSSSQRNTILPVHSHYYGTRSNLKENSLDIYTSRQLNPLHKWSTVSFFHEVQGLRKMERNICYWKSLNRGNVFKLNRRIVVVGRWCNIIVSNIETEGRSSIIEPITITSIVIDCLLHALDKKETSCFQDCSFFPPTELR